MRTNITQKFSQMSALPKVLICEERMHVFYSKCIQNQTANRFFLWGGGSLRDQHMTKCNTNYIRRDPKGLKKVWKKTK